jgi:hypothetical protein
MAKISFDQDLGTRSNPKVLIEMHRNHYTA